MGELILERKMLIKSLAADENAEQVDWEHIKTVNYNRKNINSLKRQCKKMLETGKYFQVHICGWEDEGGDPFFQEFHNIDGSVFKMF